MRSLRWGHRASLPAAGLACAPPAPAPLGGRPVLGSPRGRCRSREPREGQSLPKVIAGWKVRARRGTQAPRAFATSLPPWMGWSLRARPQGGAATGEPCKARLQSPGESRQSPACRRQSKVPATPERPRSTHCGPGPGSRPASPQRQSPRCWNAPLRLATLRAGVGPSATGHLRIPVPPSPPDTQGLFARPPRHPRLCIFMLKSGRRVKHRPSHSRFRAQCGGAGSNPLRPCPPPPPAPVSVDVPLLGTS